MARVDWDIEEIAVMAEQAEEIASAELEAFGCVWPDDEEPVRLETREDAHAFLSARLDVLDVELDESGVEDALDWERWDEYENALYSLAEFEVFA